MNRVRFRVAVAVIAAAIADPAVEFASNCGWFGPGHFTDHSSLDVVPALSIGIGMLALYLLAKARLLIADRVPPRAIVAMLPSIFAVQILTLYAMETSEQLLAYGHVLGPAVWLGGPWPVSLVIHATVCIAVAYSIARSMRSLAATTLRVIRFIAAVVRLAPCGGGAIASLWVDQVSFKELSRALRRVGQRAPPLIAG